jgi:predicted dehydrogenase
MTTYRIAAAGLPQDSHHRLALGLHPRFEFVEPDDAHLDAILIASPPASHRDEVLAALARGLHAIVVPPFALGVADAAAMTEAAAAAGKACGVAYDGRFVPQAQATKELIENAHLGALRSIEIARQSGGLRAAMPVERGWWFEREAGGGAASIGLSHAIDLAVWFAGRAPARTAGFARTANPQRRDRDGAFAASAGDGAFAILDFGEGLIARLSEDRTAPVDSYVCAVYGEDRVAVTSGLDATEATLYTVDDDETNELQCKPSPYAKAASKHPRAAYLMELYDALIAQIETGTSALPTFAEALETQRIVATLSY